MSRLKYRHEVDGLRALAAISVLLFHLKIPFISGGFAGVDIFYVISGFVIFRLILNDLQNDHFSIADFYIRRIRRILPAIAATILFSLALGYFLLMPQELVNLVESALAAMLSVSNFYFMDRMNYFGPSADDTALLHTWSLGIEEQFYIFLPLFVLAVVRYFGPARLTIAVVTFTLLSFFTNLVLLYIYSKYNQAFYLPFTRFWEIGTGCLVALAEPRFTLSKSWRQVLSFAGFAGLLVTLFWLNDDLLYPGFAALLPVLSTAMIILAKPQPGGWAYRSLTSLPAQFLGKISYSLYLFHWPVIVFAGIYLGRDTSAVEKVLMFAVITVLAFFSWKFVETPFRVSKSEGHTPKWIWPGLTAVSSVVFVVSLIAMFGKGLPERLNPAALKVFENLDRRGPKNIRCEAIAQDADGYRVKLCRHSGSDQPLNYIITGDSHARMYVGTLFDVLSQKNITGAFLSLPSCPSLVNVASTNEKNRRKCQFQNTSLINYVKTYDVDTVILSSRWATYTSNASITGRATRAISLLDMKNNLKRISFKDALKRMIDQLHTAGAKVIILGPVPEHMFHVPNMLARVKNFDAALPQSRRSHFDKRQKIVLAALQDLASMPNVTVIYPHLRLCNQSTCYIEKNARPLYYDDDHLSRAGVHIVMDEIERAIITNIKVR